MCTEPLYAIRLKTEFDIKFKRFGKRSPIKVLCAVRDIGKDTDKLNYDKIHYDLLMISCGQCMQCRLLRVKQRATMCIAEALEHSDNSFVTLTFGYPQLYSYYRHTKGLSHYMASKKAHFHEWSLEVEFFQKFMKRLRNWYYNYQLSSHLLSIGRSDLVPSTFPFVTHIYLPKEERSFLLKDFKPNKIRVMHCGEYGDKKQRPHHHCILFGFQFPDLKAVDEWSSTGERYYTSEILSKLWTFGIHRIGECSYKSCAYVARYVTKKVNGVNADKIYNGRKPEYITYSTKPVLGANYFIKNYKEIVNTQVLTVVADKKYQCHMPKSYDIILKRIDKNLYNQMKDDRVKNALTDFDKLMKQPRSIYSKLNSNQKITMCTLRKLVRGFESSNIIDVDEYLSKAKAFGVSTKFFDSEFINNAKDYLDKRTFRDHISKSSNQSLHDKYYQFELARKRHINNCFNIFHSDALVMQEFAFYYELPNPYKVIKRGKMLPDTESVNDTDYIDEKGRSMFYE